MKRVKRLLKTSLIIIVIFFAIAILAAIFDPKKPKDLDTEYMYAKKTLKYNNFKASSYAFTRMTWYSNPPSESEAKKVAESSYKDWMKNYNYAKKTLKYDNTKAEGYAYANQSFGEVNSIKKALNEEKNFKLKRYLKKQIEGYEEYANNYAYAKKTHKYPDAKDDKYYPKAQAYAYASTKNLGMGYSDLKAQIYAIAKIDYKYKKYLYDFVEGYTYAMEKLDFDDDNAYKFAKEYIYARGELEYKGNKQRYYAYARVGLLLGKSDSKFFARFAIDAIRMGYSETKSIYYALGRSKYGYVEKEARRYAYARYELKKNDSGARVFAEIYSKNIHYGK